MHSARSEKKFARDASRRLVAGVTPPGGLVRLETLIVRAVKFARTYVSSRSSRDDRGGRD